jgi:hypothetical protein
MGYLDSTEITVDAILTKKGRQKLASGEALNITKFALGDDEVDYSLYDPTDERGSAFYDETIRNLPITEATVDESLALRYKLVTLPKNTNKIPVVEFGITEIKVGQGGGHTAISPTTSPSGNNNAGYTLILADSSVGSLTVTKGNQSTGTLPVFLGDDVTTASDIKSGLEFRFTPNSTISATISTTLTVVGNETGGTSTIPVTVIYQP